MGRDSFSPASTHLSPKSKSPNLNINPFSPLSPDLPESQPLPNKGPFIHYSRRKLLRIAQQCRLHGWQMPSGMDTLEAWFGQLSPAKPFHQGQVDDPAIASIGPPAGASRRGGYGEGFGFGGGIGAGRGLVRGPRNNVGLRRLADLDANGLPVPDNRRETGQMGKFSMRPGGREDRPHDWRRDMRNGETSRRTRLQTREEETMEPAWMEDAAPSLDTVEPDLVHFAPGQDMIAAHKRAMKSRSQADWRGDKPLISFFDEAAPPQPQKPKVFNAADYLRPTRDGSDDEAETKNTSDAFSSRFQKFFASSASPSAVPPTISPFGNAPMAAHTPDPGGQTGLQPQPPEQRGDHMAKLMGLLSSKSPGAQGSSSTAEARNPASVPQEPSQRLGPTMFLPSPGIQDESRRAPDPFQLLAHAQRQQLAAPHHSFHPQMFVRPGPMYSQHDVNPISDPLRDYQQPNYMPGPPRESYYPPPGFPPPQYSFPRPPPFSPPNITSQAQQDMLASLFQNLGPRRS
ncbi:hypothetical protein BCR39DRAFT_527383 [Naematelia encephala]|uniref:Uncharacterized protein n=1 Tax=Naematelia encephala TaxID=71784 RepID=A0A1Y2B8Z9_9TREE|nr:hypothetical protein BCR39DRAFT_527383 [Naematelia encephala]